MSEDYPPFNLLQTPLRDGTNLIEASAGTGKTFTIAGLVLRLLLERNYGIEQILVTTFTELATAELRGRVRHRLREALALLERDELVASVLERGACTPEEARERLDIALRTFDEAPIYTIHGFCQRMLKDGAFESGILFDAELIQDESIMLREVAEDFWRTHFYEDSEIVTLTARRNGIGVDALIELLLEIRNKPDALILPESKAGELSELCEQLSGLWTAITLSWERWVEDIRGFFREPGWAKNNYAKPEKMLPLLEELEGCFRQATGTRDELKCLRAFGTAEIARFTRANTPHPPRHEFFELCQEFTELNERFAVVLKSNFCVWAREELERRKLRRNVLSFTDQLVRLRDALRGPAGPQLAEVIRGKFKAALLDEFQDTDPVQEEIFRRIYAPMNTPLERRVAPSISSREEKAESEAPSPLERRWKRSAPEVCSPADTNPLYLIGDPKQAIYGFRGADVFSYIDAAEQADEKSTLTKNWRSSTPLVGAVNALFASHPLPFALEQIRFQPVAASERADQSPLLLDGRSEPPFRIWMVDAEKPLLMDEARALLAERTAEEIARLLADRVTLGEARLRPGHMAVLVANRKEARQVEAALAKKRIPSVLSGAQSVFESEEAEELQRILSAVAEPGRESLLRAAVTTRLFGLTADAMLALTADVPEWEALFQRFAGHHEQWSKHGFSSFLRRFLIEEKVRSRCLAQPGGERRLTNLLHLSELIQRACSERKPSIPGTLKWLARQMTRPDPDRTEEFELRLERDDDAVRILTIHKSKGLEFDLVFCPFIALTPGHKGGPQFHDAENRLIIPLGEVSDESATRAALETLAERLRLLYVALTRAKHRCTIAWGALKTKDSALSYLADNSISEHPGMIQEPLPAAGAPDYQAEDSRRVKLAACVFDGRIDRSWGITSFTGLTRGHQAEPMLPEFTEDEPSTRLPEPAIAPEGIAAFPRGTQAGTCLHEIFEQIEFTDDASIAPVVQRKLAAFGYREQDETVCAAVRQTLEARLLPDFSLSQLGADARLTELEFHFPVNDLTAAALNEFFGAGWSLAFPHGNGFLKGFVDLAFAHDGRFYVLDWKSNWLGTGPEAYTAEAMSAEMQRHRYALQLHLYVLALHRYLSLRQPGYDYEKHFGGAFYLFIRGIDPAIAGAGIYQEKPARNRIEALNRLFQGKAK